MKIFIFYLVLLWPSSPSYSQINIDSICKDCERYPKQDCSYYKYEMPSLDYKKLDKDIKVVLQLEKYITSADTTFRKKYRKTKQINYEYLNGNSYKVEELNLNYFKVFIYLVNVNNTMVKGYFIGKSKITYCEVIGRISYIDSRILKKLLSAFKLPYHLSVCAFLFVNIRNDFTIYKPGYISILEEIKLPTKITFSEINPAGFGIGN